MACRDLPLIDREGRIRYKHIGLITPESLQTQIMPKVEELRHCRLIPSSSRPGSTACVACSASARSPR